MPNILWLTLLGVCLRHLSGVVSWITGKAMNWLWISVHISWCILMQKNVLLPISRGVSANQYPLLQTSLCCNGEVAATSFSTCDQKTSLSRSRLLFIPTVFKPKSANGRCSRFTSSLIFISILVKVLKYFALFHHQASSCAATCVHPINSKTYRLVSHTRPRNVNILRTPASLNIGEE